jgi:hypothetical protein
MAVVLDQDELKSIRNGTPGEEGAKAVWRFLLNKMEEQADAMDVADKVEPLVEHKCQEGHLLSKENGYFCVACDVKYYPKNAFNFFDGKDRVR